MLQRKKRSIRPQAAGGALIIAAAAGFLGMLIAKLQPGFWHAAWIFVWLAIANAVVLSVTGAIALSVIRLIGRAKDQTG